MSLFAVALIASILGRPATLVEKVYASFGYDPILAVAVVEGESWFNPKAQRRYQDGSTDFGLWQLNDRWHPQHRDNLQAHIEYGASFLLLLTIETGGSRRRTLILYNGSTSYPERILPIYERIRVAVLLDRRYAISR